MKKELKRTNGYLMVQDRIIEVKKSTKKSPAKVTIAIDDELAGRLITNMIVKMNFLRSDWAAVGLALQWIEIDYLEDKNANP